VGINVVGTNVGAAVAETVAVGLTGGRGTAGPLQAARRIKKKTILRKGFTDPSLNQVHAHPELKACHPEPFDTPYWAVRVNSAKGNML